MKGAFSLSVYCFVLFYPVHCLDHHWVDYVAGMNCTSLLSSDQINSTSAKCKTWNPTSQCPPWYCPSQDNLCQSGDTLRSVIFFQDRTNQPHLLPFYCMTTSQNGTQRKDVIGGCLFSTNTIRDRLFFPLPCNISELNEFMCAGLNREGQLCGKCKEGYGPPAYSYLLKCINCTEYSYKNWLKYSAVAFGPLTVFCIIVIVFHISATSPYLHGFILFCHLISTPTALRLIVNSHGYQYYHNTNIAIKVYTSIIGIWNLDFFRLVYHPFCLHPKMTIVQTLALDYLIAVYPLALICITYMLVSLHNRNCKILHVLWSPIRKILRPFLCDLNIKATLIESFATLYLLSVMKFQCVSLDLLVPTLIYSMDGSYDSKLYLYLAGDVAYLGQEHLPYAILAASIFTFLVIFPMVLLFIYPFQCFQKCLNKTNCNFQVLRTFMDVFQGHYRDRTRNSRDYRCFSGVFLLVRTVLIIQFSLWNSYMSVIFICLIITVLVFILTLLHPQRSHVHYILDSVFLILLSVIMFALIADSTGAHNVFPSATLLTLGILSATLPLLHIVGLVLYWIFRAKRIPQRLFHAMCTKIGWTSSNGELDSLLTT